MTSRTIHRKARSLIGQRLLALRQAKGLTQEDVAHTIGIEQSLLSKIERGSGVSLNTLMKLVTLYGSSLDYVVQGDDAAA